MSFTSRTTVILGLLVASLCVTANAGRDLAGTSKLVKNLFANGGRTVGIEFTIDAVGMTSLVAMAMDNGMGGTVQMNVEPGVVNKLKPIAVAVKVDKLVAITLTRNGETKTFTTDLAAVTTAVKRVDSPVTTASTLEDDLNDFLDGLPP